MPVFAVQLLFLSFMLFWQDILGLGKAMEIVSPYQTRIKLSLIVTFPCIDSEYVVKTSPLFAVGVFSRYWMHRQVGCRKKTPQKDQIWVG